MQRIVAKVGQKFVSFTADGRVQLVTKIEDAITWDISMSEQVSDGIEQMKALGLNVRLQLVVED